MRPVIGSIFQVGPKDSHLLVYMAGTVPFSKQDDEVTICEQEERNLTIMVKLSYVRRVIIK